MPLLDPSPILVTGGERGLGTAIARSLYRHGASVVINYQQSEQAAHALVAELGERAWALQADVRDAAQAISRPTGSRVGCCATPVPTAPHPTTCLT